MAENRTNEAFRRRFRTSNPKGQGGFVNGNMYIPRKEDEEKKEDGRIRQKIQMEIRELIKEGHGTAQIKEKFSKEEYKNYAPYIDKWIEGWLIKVNPNIKNKIKKLLDKGLNQKLVLELVKANYKEMYEAYEPTIKQIVKDEIETRKRKEKSKEEDER